MNHMNGATAIHTTQRNSKLISGLVLIIYLGWCRQDCNMRIKSRLMLAFPTRGFFKVSGHATLW